MESYSPNSTKKLCETEAKPPSSYTSRRAAVIRPMMNSTQGIATLLPSALYRAESDAPGISVHPSGKPAALTLQRCQASDEIGIGFRLLANEIGGVLMLAGALCADYAVLTEIIHTLAAVDCMMISGRQLYAMSR